jgi:hypothetical protein
VVAVLGIFLAILGAWTALKLGPSGEVHFSARSKVPGVIVVEPAVLNAVDAPVRVKATRSDGGAIWLAVAPSADTSDVLGRSAVSRVSGVHYPAGTLDLRTSGTGGLADIQTSDVWRTFAKGSGSAELVVDQDRAPERMVVTSGDSTALADVTMTVTWADRTWFFEALTATVIGAIIVAFALGDLWHISSPRPRRRSRARTGDGGSKASEVPT